MKANHCDDCQHFNDEDVPGAKVCTKNHKPRRYSQKAVYDTERGLNGLYGNLGTYSSFYAPELMLAVCLTGQINLLNLIDRLAKQKGYKRVCDDFLKEQK